MSPKYRKLNPSPLLALAREVSAAAHAVVEMAQQVREEAYQKATTARTAFERHHFVDCARELNAAVRSLVDYTNPLREELFLAAKEVPKGRCQRKDAAPKCGALKASGGRCGTRVVPGEFRCPLHAEQMRKRRIRPESPSGADPGCENPVT